MKKKVFLIIFFSLVIIGMGYGIYKLNKKVETKTKQISDLEKASLSANSRYNQLMYTKDSLAFINVLLSKYRVLTDAMKYRDSVRLLMQYSVGDEVMLKKDSSRAIVSDIVIGGSKHEYYIKYKILFKNGDEEIILPELLY
ncbi:MAG: hypothetical protein V1904_00685 [Bacteroidota bacterium]